MDIHNNLEDDKHDDDEAHTKITNSPAKSGKKLVAGIVKALAKHVGRILLKSRLLMCLPNSYQQKWTKNISFYLDSLRLHGITYIHLKIFLQVQCNYHYYEHRIKLVEKQMYARCHTFYSHHNLLYCLVEIYFHSLIGSTT